MSRIRVTLGAACLAAFGLTMFLGEAADARPSKCFGKKINTVVKGNNKKAKLGFKDVAWIAGNDRIFIGKSSLSIARGGLGNDLIVGSKGHDFIYGSPRKVPKGAKDKDTIRGQGGNDRIYDYGGTGNLLYGVTGVDRIYSLGRAISSSFGGNGSDFLYSDGGRARSGRS